MAFLINFAQFDAQNGPILDLGGAILVKNGQFFLWRRGYFDDVVPNAKK